MTPRRTVAELFERGFRRNRAAPLAIKGATCTGAEDNTVAFSFDVADGRISGVGFRASCCATLIAYCEYIAEIAPSFRPEIARELTAANLVESVPGVPALKRDRALLAIAGFRAALMAAETNPPPSCRACPGHPRLEADAEKRRGWPGRARP